MCLVYIREQLHEVNRLESMINAATWMMYGHLLMEEQVSTMSTDIIHNYLINTVTHSSIVSPATITVRTASLD